MIQFCLLAVFMFFTLFFYAVVKLHGAWKFSNTTKEEKKHQFGWHTFF